MNSIQKIEPHSINVEDVHFEEQNMPESNEMLRMAKGMLRYWYIILISFVLIGGIGVPAVWYFIKPQFQAMGQIRIVQNTPNVLFGDDETGELHVNNNLSDQAFLMTRDRILYRVYHLLKDNDLNYFKMQPENNAEQGQLEGVDKLVASVREFFSQPAPETPIEKLRAAIKKGTITIEPRSRNSEYIDVSMVSRNGAEAKKIVDAFLDAYMTIEGLQLSESTQKKIQMLENQAKLTAVDMQLQEEAIRQMAEEYGSVALSPRQEMMLKKVEALQQQLLGVQAKRLQLEVRVQVLEKSKDQSSLETSLLQQQQLYVRNDPLYQSLTSRIAELEEKLVSAKVSMRKDNPELVQAQELLHAYKQSLVDREVELVKTFKEEYVTNYKQNNKSQLEIARAELEQTEAHEEILKSKLDEQDIDTIKLGRKQLDIEQAQGKLQMAKDMHKRIQERIQMLEIERKRDPSIGSIAASVSPMENKRMKMSLAVIFASLGVGLGISYLLARSDRSLYTPDDIIRSVGLPILGTTANSDQLDQDEIVEQTAYDYQAIRANLGVFGDGKIPHILAVTSPNKNEGKTTFSINLASSLAQAGNKVLLIDGDFRKPDIGQILNVPDLTMGLPDVLLDKKSMDEVVYAIPLTGLNVLAGDSEYGPVAIDQLSQAATQSRIHEICEPFDHVIIDTPPVMACPDAMLWSKMAGNVVLCSLAGQTTSPELRETLDRLNRANVNILGSVLSNVKSRNSYNKYTYGYYGAYKRNIAKDRKKASTVRPLLISNEESGHGT